jgi:hypothetical protein
MQELKQNLEDRRGNRLPRKPKYHSKKQKKPETLARDFTGEFVACYITCFRYTEKGTSKTESFN